MGKIVGTIRSDRGVNYYVRHEKIDHIVSISPNQTGPWWHVSEGVTENEALKVAREYIESQSENEDSVF